ncbi:MAG: hypothetical protein IAI49_16640, partial [Candidatus Eremiobacteraeota bacterium]|nr:hypothetical protein [Candidatus Eremiobacteraeota bacterium]
MRTALPVAVAFATALGIAFACGAPPLTAPVSADQPVIVKLGLDLPLSGIDGSSSLPARNGVLLAIEEAN